MKDILLQESSIGLFQQQWTEFEEKEKNIKELIVQKQQRLASLHSELHKQETLIQEMQFGGKEKVVAACPTIDEYQTSVANLNSQIIPKYGALLQNQNTLEAIDPCHRRSMIEYYNSWIKEKNKKELPDFFLWLEDKNVLFNTPLVQTLNNKKIRAYVIRVIKGKLCNSQGKPLTTEQTSKEPDNHLIKDHIFIINKNLNILMNYNNSRLSHASLSNYLPIIGAGTLKVEKGLIKEISFNSGHYCPTIKHNLQTLKAFKKLGVIISDEVLLTYYEGFTEKSSTAKEFNLKYGSF